MFADAKKTTTNPASRFKIKHPQSSESHNYTLTYPYQEVLHQNGGGSAERKREETQRSIKRRDAAGSDWSLGSRVINTASQRRRRDRDRERPDLPQRRSIRRDEFVHR